MPTRKRSSSLTNSYRKQHGLHHKHNSQYIKVYWPYLPISILVLAGIFTSIAILAVKPHSDAVVSSTSLVSDANETRSDNGAQPLDSNSQLAQAAQAKANQLVSQNYFGPVAPDGQTPQNIALDSGYKFQQVTESLAYGFSSSANIVNAWADSSSSKVNILNGNFSDVGFGIAQSKDFLNKGPQTVVVAFYGSPSTTGSAAPIFNGASIVESHTETVSRIETLTAVYTPWVVSLSLILAVAAFIILAIRHSLIIRKWAVEGEKLVISHPIFDLVLVIFIVGFAIINQTVGVIN